MKNRKSQNEVSMTLKAAALFLFVFFNSYIQSFCNDSDSYGLLPGDSEKSKFEGAVSLSLTIIPREIVEEEIAQIPTLNFDLSYELTKNISLHSKLRTVYLTNSIAMGASWDISGENMSFSIGDMTEYWFGTAKMENFDASSSGLINRLYLSFEYNFNNNNKIIAKAETVINLTQKSNIGGILLKERPELFSGFAFSINIQQTLWQNNDFIFGAKLNYTNPSKLVWLAFPDKNNRTLYPELTLGYVL